MIFKNAFGGLNPPRLPGRRMSFLSLPKPRLFFPLFCLAFVFSLASFHAPSHVLSLSSSLKSSFGPFPFFAAEAFAFDGGGTICDLQRRAKQGDPEAQFRLGQAHLLGDGVSFSKSMAYQWLIKALSSGHQGARLEIERALVRRRGVVRDEAMAAGMLMADAQQGNAEAMFLLALAYRDGRGVGKDLKLFEEWLQKASAAGSREARLISRDGTSKSEALRALRKEAESGDVDAQLELGAIYLGGEGLPKSRIMARKWLSKAAGSGSLEAASLLAELAAEEAAKLSMEEPDSASIFRFEEADAMGEAGFNPSGDHGSEAPSAPFSPAKSVYAGSYLSRNQIGESEAGYSGQSALVQKPVAEPFYEPVLEPVSRAANIGLEAGRNAESLPETYPNASSLGAEAQLPADEAAPGEISPSQALFSQASFGPAYSDLGSDTKSYDAKGWLEELTPDLEPGVEVDSNHSIPIASSGAIPMDQAGAEKEAPGGLDARVDAAVKTVLAMLDGGGVLQDGIAIDGAAAIALLEPLALDGDLSLQILLGDAYASGAGVPKDDRKAFEFFSLAAWQESAIAQKRVAEAFREGLGVGKSSKSAFEWLLRAAQGGDLEAARLVGQEYLRGVAVSASLDSALSWLGKAAASGDVEAQLALADLFSRGELAPRDCEAAYGMYMMAAEAGSALAMRRIGDFHKSGHFAGADPGAAKAWYERAAGEGDSEAMLELGAILKEADPDKARQWLEKAAGAGRADALNALGSFELARGAAGEAFKSFLKSAEKGDPEGQFQAGISLLGGSGAPLDPAAAFAWLQKSASQGYRPALDKLQELGY